jgi:hypothetical protein
MASAPLHYPKQHAIPVTHSYVEHCGSTQTLTQLDNGKHSPAMLRQQKVRDKASAGNETLKMWNSEPWNLGNAVEVPKSDMFI